MTADPAAPPRAQPRRPRAVGIPRVATSTRATATTQATLRGDTVRANLTPDINMPGVARRTVTKVAVATAHHVTARPIAHGAAANGAPCPPSLRATRVAAATPRMSARSPHDPAIRGNTESSPVRIFGTVTAGVPGPRSPATGSSSRSQPSGGPSCVPGRPPVMLILRQLPESGWPRPRRPFRPAPIRRWRARAHRPIRCDRQGSG